MKKVSLGKVKELKKDNLSTFRKRKERHVLNDVRSIQNGAIYNDPKTGVSMEAVDQPLLCLGSGTTRGLGIQLLEKQPANKIIVISQEPLQKMDLNTYSEEDYQQNKWYVFYPYAIRSNDFTMLGNTRSPANLNGKMEVFNAKLIKGVLPIKDALRQNNMSGVYIYIRTTRIIEAREFVLFENYGKGRHCLLWGQKPTLQRQLKNMKRFDTNEQIRSSNPQKGNKTCNACGNILPRTKNMKMKHRFVCPKDKVKGTC